MLSFIRIVHVRIIIERILLCYYMIDTEQDNTSEKFIKRYTQQYNEKIILKFYC